MQKNYFFCIEWNAKNNFLSFDFHFGAQFTRWFLNFDIFELFEEFSKGFSPTKDLTAFLFTFPKSRVLRHTSIQGESFSSFWDAATYDKLYFIVRRELVVVRCMKNPFQSASRLHQHRCEKFHSSDFASACECIRSASRRCESCLSTYPSPAYAFTTTISGWFPFQIIRKRIFNVYVFAFASLSTPHSSHFFFYFSSRWTLTGKLSTLFLPVFLSIFRGIFPLSQIGRKWCQRFN